MHVENLMLSISIATAYTGTIYQVQHMMHANKSKKKHAGTLTLQDRIYDTSFDPN